MHFRTKLLTIFILLLAVAGLFVFSTKSPFVNAEEADEVINLVEEKDTIYFWYSDETMSDYINSAAVVFGEKYGVRVMPQLVSGREYLEAINSATMQGELAPDAYLITNETLEKAYLSGLAAEVDSVENSVVNEQNFPKAALDAVTYKGKKIAYPLSYETTVMLYNESFLYEWALQQVKNEAKELGVNYDGDTLLQKRDELMLTAVPETIDKLLLVSDSFDPPESVECIFKWDVSDIFYNYHFVGNYMIIGGDCGDDKNNININNPETIQCLEMYKALNQFFYIESDSVSYESVIEDFLAGKIVFTIVTSDAVATLEEAEMAETFPYSYGMTLVPDSTEVFEGRPLSVTNTVAVNGYSENKDLANQFAAFLTTEYAGELYVRTGKLAANKNYNTDHPLLQVFAQAYAESIPLNKMMETSNLWLQLEILFAQVWNGEEVSTLVAELEQQLESQIIKE